jgi:hypothetical protein
MKSAKRRVICAHVTLCTLVTVLLLVAVGGFLGYTLFSTWTMATDAEKECMVAEMKQYNIDLAILAGNVHDCDDTHKQQAETAKEHALSLYDATALSRAQYLSALCRNPTVGDEAHWATCQEKSDEATRDRLYTTRARTEEKAYSDALSKPMRPWCQEKVTQKRDKESSKEAIESAAKKSCGLKRDEVWIHAKSEFLPQKVLGVFCGMWHSRDECGHALGHVMEDLLKHATWYLWGVFGIVVLTIYAYITKNNMMTTFIDLQRQIRAHEQTVALENAASKMGLVLTDKIHQQ